MPKVLLDIFVVVLAIGSGVAVAWILDKQKDDFKPVTPADYPQITPDEYPFDQG